MGVIASKTGDKIQSRFSSACVLLVRYKYSFDRVQLDNTKLSRKENALQLHIYDKQWKVAENALELEENGTLETLASLLQENRHWKIIDFDNHLDDISKDWINQQIN